MSGGHWGYMEWRFRERAEQEKAVWEALADLERIMDRALSGDTSMEDELAPDGSVERKGAKIEVWERLERLFDDLGGEA